MFHFEMDEFIFCVADINDYASWSEHRTEMFDDCLDQGVLSSGRQGYF